MQNLTKRLEKRGWNKKEILKAVSIIKKAKQEKSAETTFLEKRIYWVLLVVLAAANFAVSVALIPLLISLKGIFLYFILIVMGVVFGVLFELVIRSIEHLEKKHHVILAVLIPLIALANAFAISRISNGLAKTLDLANLHNPAIIALVYAVSFVMPYIVCRFVLEKGYYANK